MEHACALNENFGTIRVLIAENDANVRSAIKCAVEQYPGVSIAAEVSTSNGLVGQILEMGADILLLDWELPGGHLLEFLRGVTTKNPHLIIIAISNRPESRYQALEAGASYFIIKGEPPELLINAIVHVANWCRGNKEDTRRKI